MADIVCIVLAAVCFVGANASMESMDMTKFWNRFAPFFWFLGGFMLINQVFA